MLKNGQTYFKNLLYGVHIARFFISFNNSKITDKYNETVWIFFLFISVEQVLTGLANVTIVIVNLLKFPDEQKLLKLLIWKKIVLNASVFRGCV